MIEFKQNTVARVPVRLFDSTGAPKTGVAFASIAVTIEWANGGFHTPSLVSGDWIEVTSGAFINTGKYTLVLPATALAVPGCLTYVVSATGAKAHVGVVKVIANEEAETKAVADAIKAKTDIIPSNPLLTTDSRLNNLDATISSRLPTSGYTAPDNADILLIKAKTDNLPTNPASQTNLDVAVSTRLATASYTAPDNVSITAIKAKTDNLPSDPASATAVSAIPTNPLLTTDLRLNNLDATVSSRLSAGAYTAPDNAGIAAIKVKTDNLPLTPASQGDVTSARDAIQGTSGRNLTEMAGAAFVATDSLHDIKAAGGGGGGGGLTPAEHAALFAIEGKTTNLPPDPASEFHIDEVRDVILAAIPPAPDNAGISAIKAKTDNLPSDPASNAQVSTRLATSSYVAPDNSSIGLIKSKTDTLPANPASQTNLDVPVSSRLAAAAYTSPSNTDIAAIRAKTDNLPADPASNTQVNTRLAFVSYVAPNNAGITAIKAKTDNLPADPASNTQVNTRLAAADFIAPNNAGIAAIQAKTANLPANPASQTNLDVPVSTRMASGSFVAPDNSGIAAIKAKTDNLPVDPASNTQVNTRLASSSYVPPSNATIATIASDVTTIKATTNTIQSKTVNLPANPASQTNLDVPVSTRLAAVAYVAPLNADISLIKVKTDNLPADPASETSVGTRLAASAYVAPDNASIAAIKTQTDTLPTNPASEAHLDAVEAAILAAMPSEPDNAGIAAVQAKTAALPVDPASSSVVLGAISGSTASIKGSDNRDLSQLAGTGFNPSLENLHELHGIAVTTATTAADTKTDTQRIRIITEGKWKLDPITKHMIFYDTDGTTIIREFAMFDDQHRPSIDRVYERDPL